MEAGPRDTSPHPPDSDHETLTPDGPEEDRLLGDTVASGESSQVSAALSDAADLLDPDELDELDNDSPEPGTGESFRELRPPRRLRIWQLAPIVGVAILGSLMFAFPLAFEFDGGGAVVAMLGLLLSCCAAGWGLMAARRVGYTWPGLPQRGSGRRPDWRFVLLYVVIVGLLAALAIWRVARLR